MGWGGEVAILNLVVRIGLCEKRTLSKDMKEVRKWATGLSVGRAFKRENSKCKSPEGKTGTLTHG